MNRTLLVVDSYDAAALQRIDDNSDPIDILLLARSREWFLRNTEIGRQIDAGTSQVIDLSRLADAAHDLVINCVRTDLAAAPTRRTQRGSIADALAHPNGSLWWYLDAAEWSPFRGVLISRLYNLAIFQLATNSRKYERITVDLQDRPLADVFFDFDAHCLRSKVTLALQHLR